MKSICLSYDEVAAILEEHINREILRTLHHVTRVDPWDWDADNEHQFCISLEPGLIGAAPVAAPDPTADFAAHLFDPPPAPANGAGTGLSDHEAGGRIVRKNGRLVIDHTPLPASAQTQEATAVPSTDAPKRSRRRSAETRAEVVRLADAGTRQSEICKRLGLASSTVCTIIKESRAAEAGQPEA